MKPRHASLRKSSALAIVATSLLCSSLAYGSMQNAVFAAHYKPKFIATSDIPNLCDNPATTAQEPNYSPNYTNTWCQQYSVDQSPLGPGQVYVVVAHAGSEGVAGVSFGVDYNGSTGSGINPLLVSWTPCADGLSYPNNDGVHGDFPQPGGGLRLTWLLPSSCQFQNIAGQGVHVVVGVFYVYAYSDETLRLTPNNNLQSGPEVAVADCGGVETNLTAIWGPNIVTYRMARVGFGSLFGLNPCLVTPVAPTTWGKLKSLYGSGA